MPPSQLHTELTRRVRPWIRRRVTGAGLDYATEVYLAESYVADAVVIASLQYRFLLETSSPSKHPWRSTCDPLHSSHSILPERLVIVFETKVSRSDFLATFRPRRSKPCSSTNRSNSVGNLHYLVTTDDIKCDDCLPPFWGVLCKSGGGLKQVKSAQFQDISQERLYHAAFRVLLASARNPRCFICLQSIADETCRQCGSNLSRGSQPTFDLHDLPGSTTANASIP